MFKDRRSQQRFERNLERLELELSQRTARRHLDVLVDLLETILDSMLPTLVVAANRQKLNAVKARVATRHNLRLVHS
jgi:hypothetical protein